MVHYILQIIAFQLFFLIIYDVFLKKETFFNWNRGYLLSTSILSFILPSIKIKALQESIPQEFIFNLPEVVITSRNDELVNTILLDTIYIADTSISFVEWIFYIGFVVSVTLFTLKLLKIAKLIHRNPKVTKEGFRLVNLGKSSAAFSFLNYIFIGEKIEQIEAAQILEHEKIHVEQKHTLDLLYFELLRILFWFNPLIYIYQNRIAELHEFIADSKAIKQQSKSHYYQNLLAQIFDTNKVSFINTFFKQSLIKKRIIMLSKQKSKQILKLKYALLIPLVFGMLIYTSCADEADGLSSSQDINLSQFTHTLKLNENMSGEVKAIHTKYEAFLRANPNYVSWGEIDKATDEITYTIHLETEDVPESYNTSKATFPDGTSYTSYMNVSYFDYAHETSLKKKVDALKKQIEVQGNVDDHEMKGFDLLLRAIKGDKKDEALISEIQSYQATKNESTLTSKIVDVFEQIQKQGNISDDEYRTLKTLMLLVSPNGFSDSFFQDVIEYAEIPYGVVDQVPVYPGCESGSNEEQKKCMSQSVSKFVAENFNTKVGDEHSLTGRQKIYVQFKIDNHGNVVNVKARAPHEALENEAQRVVAMLPKMKPGMQEGKAVNVPYSLPIVFQINE